MIEGPDGRRMGMPGGMRSSRRRVTTLFERQGWECCRRRRRPAMKRKIRLPDLCVPQTRGLTLIPSDKSFTSLD
jgi:hypothetical protein